MRERTALMVATLGVVASGVAHAIPLDAEPVQTEWGSYYDNGWDYARALAVSPDGATVFVAGRSSAPGSSEQGFDHDDFTTIAYHAGTGQPRWIERYDAARQDDRALSLGVSPDGARVYVTGVSHGNGGFDDPSMITVAYDASTGDVVWLSRIPGASGDDLVVSQDGGRVYVTGVTQGGVARTVAFDSATGAQIWIAHFGAGLPWDSGLEPRLALAVSSDGERVFVSTVRPAGLAFTVAYDTHGGVPLWSDGTGGLPSVSPDGSLVVLATLRGHGESTRALDAASGVTVWEASPELFPADIGVSPDGARIYVTGAVGREPSLADYATVAYDASTGQTLWRRTYSGPLAGADAASALAVSGSGRIVYVTGSTLGSRQQNAGLTAESAYLTIAYEATSGLQLWTAKHEPALFQICTECSSFDSAPSAIAVSHDGLHVYVTGSGRRSPYGDDFLTLAYRTVG